MEINLAEYIKWKWLQAIRSRLYMVSNIDLTLAIKTPITAVASSGAELPAAMNVAPATSDSRCRSVQTKRQS